jgi:hypothetical protein
MKSVLLNTLGNDLLQVVSDRNVQSGVYLAAEDTLQWNLQGGRRSRLNSWKSVECIARSRRNSEFNITLKEDAKKVNGQFRGETRK